MGDYSRPKLTERSLLWGSVGDYSRPVINIIFLLAPAVTVGEMEGAMDSASVFFLPLLLPITL